MTEPINEPALPTYFSNGVSVLVTSDEATLELRRILVPHAEFAKLTKDGTVLPPPVTPEQFYSSPPIAKVVLTFSAAKYLRDTLNELIPKFEKERREGK